MYEFRNPDGSINEGHRQLTSARMNGLDFVGPVVGGLSNAYGAHVNAKSVKEVNQQQLQHNMEMYERQRADNLYDYHLQNAYNHPTQQMQRLQEAGLSPHLVYGEGAKTVSAQIDSARPTPAQLNAPRSGDAFMQASNIMALEQARANIERTKAETANLGETRRAKMFDNAVRDAVGQETYIALTQAQSGKAVADRDIRSLEHDQQRSRWSNEQQSWEPPSPNDNGIVRSMRAENERTVQDLDNAITDGDIKKSINIIRREEAKLMQKGIRPGDRAWERWMQELGHRSGFSELLNQTGRGIGGALNSFDRWFRGNIYNPTPR